MLEIIIFYYFSNFIVFCCWLKYFSHPRHFIRIPTFDSSLNFSMKK